MTKFTDLHCKEVICISDGRRLGFVSDARIDLCDGQITAIISDAGLNIENMANGSRGEYAYTIVELADKTTEAANAAFEAIDGIIRISYYN